ncbi:uncharacterized protein IUM83_02520 [Phytophthora cinnamomi]|uniref:uncharacterized protein n=1 Tax=Phytophthora cinnamomi TaxID=4785 RepID=UPI00355A7DBD|nr:hypothetical protein IUM83_02520 [Phytophthora cinnamomi]
MWVVSQRSRRRDNRLRYRICETSLELLSQRDTASKLRTLQHQQHNLISQGPNASITADSTEQVTSPPLSSFSEMLDVDNDFEAGLGLGSLPKESVLLHQPMTIAAGVGNENQSTQDAVDLVNFSLGQQNPLPPLAVPDVMAIQHTAQHGTPSAQPTTPCPTMWSSDDDDFTFSGGTLAQRSSTINYEDRSFRKKSREKMRRKEVNTEFELLVELLGFTNRVRKKVILHEAASTIKSLKRECNHLRRDRDILQQELAKLASHMEPYHFEYMQGQPECGYPGIC